MEMPFLYLCAWMTDLMVTFDLKFTMPFDLFTFYIIMNLFLVVLMLISVAFFTLFERKTLAMTQNSKGPNKVGYFGILQPFADGMKLFLKETMIPQNSVMVVFFMSSVFAFFFGLLFWAVLPISNSFNISDSNYAFVIIFIISVLHVYTIMLAGWASQSSYSFFGALRSSAQLIAYDISMVFVLLNLVLFTKTLNILKLMKMQAMFGWFIFYFPVLFIIFFICALAETSSHPFDLPEAEAELVSGYNVEYSAISFALFFLGEYASLLFMSIFTVNLFLGAWTVPFIHEFVTVETMKIISIVCYMIKVGLIAYLFVLMRSMMPRYRYDQLMSVGWQILLPMVVFMFFFNMLLVTFFALKLSGFYSMKLVL